jgi:hypothetical protein
MLRQSLQFEARGGRSSSQAMIAARSILSLRKAASGSDVSRGSEIAR